MSLLLVFEQKLLHAEIQRTVNAPKTSRYVLMYRAFADAERLCRRTHRSTVLDKVIPQTHAPLSLIPLRHPKRPPNQVFLASFYVWGHVFRIIF